MINTKSPRFSQWASATALGLCLVLGNSLAQAADLPAAMQAKVAKYQKQLVEWAANPRHE